MRRETPRILHVTESMGGGTAAAIVEFVRSTPQFEHHLLFRRRAGSDLPVRHEDLFAGSRDAGRGPVRLARALRETLPAVAPRIVHLHAAWAGLVGRTVVRAGAAAGPAILYTPHCFGFERTGGPAPVNRVLRAAERAVAASTDLAVCGSPREADLARALGMPAVVVPNTTRVRTARPDRRHDGSIVTVGRVRAQKDPAFLLRVKALLDRDHPGTRWTWVGGGDPRAEAALRAAGVRVTGWRSPAEVRNHLAAADVYLHTAAWESCPLPLLEAAAAGLPLVARSIPALDSLGLDPDLGTTEAVAAELATVLTTGRPGRPRLQEAFAARHTPQAQAAALAAAYARVLGPIPAPPLTRVG
ncbi:glycosyltransferase family 4 protein [Dactylosporangium siamense]|uniref:Glycosyl transferase n=1 Tax=Dactylosporangium siamense TaxID=685454 RepID=A0A919PJI5_9ACTN|nr:glycosyltransferase family 4 protein [Dactylosporangium siamense]GIG45931.1 glycosyl transferase [Dactylosporangium siamense]